MKSKAYVVWSIPFNERAVCECASWPEAMKLRNSLQRDEISNSGLSLREFRNDSYTVDWFAGTEARFRKFLADHA